LQHDFPLEVPLVPSFVITIAADGERLMCGGFSLGHHRLLQCPEPFPRKGRLSCHLHGLNSQWGTIPAVGHDKGLHRGVHHNIKQGGGLRPSLSQEARCGGSARSCHNHTMDEGRFGHSLHDNDSTVNDDAVTGYRPPF
jgi:hypothetical protein